MYQTSLPWFWTVAISQSAKVARVCISAVVLPTAPPVEAACPEVSVFQKQELGTSPPPENPPRYSMRSPGTFVAVTSPVE
jgi:hypothetical protein